MPKASLALAGNGMPALPATAETNTTIARRDRDLLRRITERDERALGLLFEHYAPLVHAIVSRMTGERADAEEVALDAFVQAWREAHCFDQSRGAARVWLVMMARSRALDWLRSRSARDRGTAAAARDFHEHAPAMGSRTPLPDHDLEHEERRQAVQGALAALPEPQRVSIEMAYYGGLSQSEIAARLGQPLGTIKTRMRLGMMKLREVLQAMQAD
jgi:RNA polymerase sigma-70 factor (ECF subfamily)